MKSGSRLRLDIREQGDVLDRKDCGVMVDLIGKRIVIAGGSGFLGLSMATRFAETGADVTILSRSVPNATGPWKHCVWDGRTIGDWAEAIDGADVVVNLAGRTVNWVKTPRGAKGSRRLGCPTDGIAMSAEAKLGLNAVLTIDGAEIKNIKDLTVNLEKRGRCIDASQQWMASDRRYAQGRIHRVHGAEQERRHGVWNALARLT